jgi:NADPH:quinone reductase-like Zn-dependent oxidoreductase
MKVMRQLVLKDSFGIEHLAERSVEKPTVKPDEILVRMQAAALNYVDLAIVEGRLGTDLPLPLIPVADGSGIVEEVGDTAQGYRVGELVATLYIPSWASGRYLPRHTKLEIRPGTSYVAGQLTEYKTFKPHEVIHAPPHLTAVEAATLPIAALTAWNALAYGNIRPGDTVLIHGTGGVSIFALQFAKMFGAWVAITSSSDSKLERARQLGADCVINYKTASDLVDEVLQATDGDGVALVVETVGGGNLAKSLSVLKAQGHISLVGFLDGVEASVNLIEMNLKRATISGISVGNTQDFRDMAAAITRSGMKPVVDAVFPLQRAAEAFRDLKAGGHFGKIVIAL